jgi:plasmid stabilization system protein ParE
MTFEVRIARRAEDDLCDIYEYVAFDLGEPEVARRVVLRLQGQPTGCPRFRSGIS